MHHPYRDKVVELYKKYKDRDGIIIVPLVLLLLHKMLRHIFWLLSSGQGLPQSTDSRWYISYTTCFWANLTDGLDINDILYFGYNTLLTALMTIFGDPVAVVFMQAIAASLSLALVFKIARILFNRTTAILASLFYFANWDITLWSLYILSDSFFVSLLLLCVYLLLRAVESRQKKYFLPFIAVALYTLVFRPTGIIAVAVIIIYLIIRLDLRKVLALIGRHRLAFGGSLAAFVAAVTFFSAAGSFDPLIKSLQFNAKMVLYNVYAKGWIYDKPTSHDYFFRSDYRINVGSSLVLSYIVNNWDHVTVLYAKRAVAFLGTWVWDTNLKTLAGIASFIERITPTALFLTGTVASIANGLFRRASILWLIVLAVFAFCVLLFIDAMYRYRFPAVPFIAIVAAYGTERLLGRLAAGAKKFTGLLPWKKENSSS